MKTQLFFDLTTEAPCPSIYFRAQQEIEEIIEELREQNVTVFEIDGAAISSREALFKVFATVLRKPDGWYRDEEYAPNADAFLEYLYDIAEWVPAKGRVVLIRNVEQF